MLTRNRGRLANALAIALLALVVLLMIVTVPLDTEARYGLLVDTIVVALTCLYAWQPRQAAQLLDAKTVVTMVLLLFTVVAIFGSSCALSGADECRAELNLHLRFDSNMFGPGIPVKMGVVLFLLALAFLTREAFARLLDPAPGKRQQR